MRSAIFAVFLSLTILAVAGAALVAQPAEAQQSRGKGKDKAKTPPPPPPPPRCPDLAVSTYTFLAQGANGAPLGANEIALQWSVNNAGTRAYEGSNAGQSLTLEYLSPSGAHQVATAPLPEAAPAADSATPASVAGVSLGQGQFWHGVLRATLPPEAARRRLRLRLDYVTDGYHPPNDCDLGNNQIDLVR